MSISNKEQPRQNLAQDGNVNRVIHFSDFFALLIDGIDDNIDKLTTAEAVWVIHRLEGPGFGQTGDGYAGADTPESHRIFVQNQINNRFGGSVHNLLKKWGTFPYNGY